MPLSRLLSNSLKLAPTTTLLVEKENPEEFLSHYLAQHISTGPYQAQGTAFAPGGDIAPDTQECLYFMKEYHMVLKKHLLNV